MNMLNLNFFGEKASIKIPESIESLRKAIQEKYFFSPSEVKDIALFYIKDFSKKIVESEEDLRFFLKQKLNELILDIKQDSQLFKQKELEMKKERMNYLSTELQKRKAEYEAKSKKIAAEKAKLEKEYEEAKKKLIKKKKEEEETKKLYASTYKKMSQELKKLKEECKAQEPKKVEKKVKVEKPKVDPIHDYAANLARYRKELGVQNKPVHYGVICDGCGANPIVGVRYKCAICGDFDFCEGCEEMNVNAHKHPFIKITDPKCKPIPHHHHHPQNIIHDYQANLKRCQAEFPKTGKPIHYGVACDGCGISPIVGVRYKCAVCQNFDFCEGCEEMNVNAHQHPFIKITDPKFKPSIIRCMINDRMPIYQKK